ILGGGGQVNVLQGQAGPVDDLQLGAVLDQLAVDGGARAHDQPVVVLQPRQQLAAVQAQVVHLRLRRLAQHRQALRQDVIGDQNSPAGVSHDMNAAI